jgi:uncharacterized protein (TIGR00661 family)
MARIAYSMSGEGRGHATRVRAMVEMLRPSHEVVLYAPGDAHELLASAYADTEVEVRPLPCLRFGYRADGRVALLGTAAAALPYLARFHRLQDRLAGELRRDRIDVAIADFEPALPRAARRAGVPVLSVDHQHLLVESRLDFLPARLQRAAAAMALAVRAYVPGARLTIVSSFYHPTPRWPRPDLCAVGVLLRPELLEATPRHGDHFTVYLRRSAPESLLTALASLGRPAHVFGLGARPALGPLEFRPISEQGFVSSLAASAALVTTAGNQVVGEAIFLGKPVLALPELGNAEQEVNASLLVVSGAGMALPMARLDLPHLRAFVARLPGLRAQCSRLHPGGNQQALAAVVQHLPHRPRSAPRGVVAPLTACLRPATAQGRS